MPLQSNPTPRHNPAYFRAFITSYFTLAAQRVHRMLAPWIFVPLMTTGYVLVSLFILRQTLQEPKGRANLISEDSKHYLQIAADFADGNFSMDYVNRRPHRQPLYPAALAPVIRFKGEDYFWLAVVNIAFATAGFLVAYAAVLHLHASRVIAALVGTLYLTNPFLIAQTTRRLMTEPLHILLMIGMIFALLTYLRDRRPIQLLVVAAAAGLDYLTRCNGLFVMVSLGGTLAVWELVNFFATRRVTCARSILRKAGLYATALLLFIVITMPSWVPRLQAFGNPVHHGYLSNYLWVDTYKEGHSGEAFANYHFRDYALTHSIGDAACRALLGLWNVGFAIPVRADLHFPLLFLLAFGGVVIAMARGPTSYRMLTVFAILQLLPLIWTNLSNPTGRVAYAATMPFEIAFAAFFSHKLLSMGYFPRFHSRIRLGASAVCRICSRPTWM